MTISEFRNKVIGKIKEKFEVEEKATHHYYFKIYFRGRRIARPYCSHGSGGKEISKKALANIKRQLLLDTPRQLDDLKECPMTGEDYFNLLKQKNVISN